MRHFQLCFTLLIASMLPMMSAGAASSAIIKAGAKLVDVTQEDFNREGGNPLWSFEKAKIGVSIPCSIKYGTLYWPSAHCGKPNITIIGNFLSNDGAAISIDDLILHNPSGKNDTSGTEIYQRLYAKQDPIILVSEANKEFVSNYYGSYEYLLQWKSWGYPIRLLDFHQIADIYLNAQHQRIEEEVRKEQAWYVGTVMLWAFGIPLFCYAMWHAARISRRVGLAVKRKTPLIMKRILKELDDWRIRRVAVEETVRHATREGLAKANEKETAALRKQISTSLEKGDTDTAKTLLSLLERLDVSQQKSSSKPHDR